MSGPAEDPPIATRSEISPTLRVEGFAALSRTAGVFIVGSAIGKAVGLVMLPILTRLLSPDSYGKLEAISALANGATVLISIHLDAAALRLYFDRSDSQRPQLLSTWLIIASVLTVPVGLGLAIFAAPVAKALFDDLTMADGISAAGLVVIAGMFQILVLTILRAAGKAGWFAVVNALGLLTYGVAAVALLLTWRQDEVSVVLAWGIGLLLSSSVAFVAIRASVRAQPSYADGVHLLRLGLPLVPAGIIVIVRDIWTRSFLLASVGASQVALFGVGLRFASVGGFIVSAIELAWLPRAYRLANYPGGRAAVSADGRHICAVIASACVSIALVAPEGVRLLAGPSYAGAIPVVTAMLVVTLANTLVLMGSIPVAIERSMATIGLATGLGAFVTIALSIVATPWGGALGTAIALAAGQTLSAGILIARAARLEAAPMDWPRIISLIAVAAIVVSAAGVAPDPLVRAIGALVWAVAVVLEGSGMEALRALGARLLPPTHE